ncbi:hypothetical protein KAFR_0A00210 [Kazachstania africana CBS 2517]|uniref:Uncharacterized protein n=1 Tax=Kazachstania africana (strain ATCC 22294 / BCRC 22015 / CBS 2517 / CECT 1963 / NBRC 1671 / NRRL Y-8276) TaxID=1071382 RepID=H2AM59_KAZAF|nr:hypothetical protein KAFR_0A00210 [Kazachstania africana CBS 2517]CCF55459.1 hypothetical protein KAFR_0A00210 [Kazachstania africana CBS 2517]
MLTAATKVSSTLRVVQRRYASAFSVKGIKVDHSLWRPLIWVVLFGSMVSHVIDAEKRLEDLDRRYKLKIDKLNTLVQRVSDNDFKFNVDEELKIVNKLFMKNPSKLRLVDMKTDKVVSDIREESLEDIWKQILQEAEASNEGATLHDATDIDIVSDNGKLKILKAREKQARVSSSNKYVSSSEPLQKIETSKFL